MLRRTDKVLFLTAAVFLAVFLSSNTCLAQSDVNFAFFDAGRIMGMILSMILITWIISKFSKDIIITLFLGFVIPFTLVMFSNNLDGLVFSSLIIGIILAYFFLRKKPNKIISNSDHAKIKDALIGTKTIDINKKGIDPKKLDIARKIGMIVVVLVALAFAMSHFSVALSSQKQKYLVSKDTEVIAPKNEIISGENVPEDVPKEEDAGASNLIDFESFNKKLNEQTGYAVNPNDNNSDNQGTDLNKVSKQKDGVDKKNQQDIADAELEINKENKKIEQEIANTKMEADKKVQESLFAKLEADKALYDAKMKKLYLDCEHQFDSIQSQENDEILKTESMLTAANADPNDEQSQQYIGRVKDKYKSEYTYFANTCEVNMKLIEATKYW
jgi:hypothetical protein